MSRVIPFGRWSKALVERAKAQGVKLSHKNMRRLRSRHLYAMIAEHGPSLNTHFQCYFDEDILREEMLKPNRFFSELAKQPDEWRGAYIPIPISFGGKL